MGMGWGRSNTVAGQIRIGDSPLLRNAQAATGRPRPSPEEATCPCILTLQLVAVTTPQWRRNCQQGPQAASSTLTAWVGVEGTCREPMEGTCSEPAASNGGRTCRQPVGSASETSVGGYSNSRVAGSACVSWGHNQHQAGAP